jgi:hypothetical protein
MLEHPIDWTAHVMEHDKDLAVNRVEIDELKSIAKETLTSVHTLSERMERLLVLQQTTHTPLNCPVGQQVSTYVVETLKAHEVAITALKEAKGELTGGGKVVLWVVGGSLLTFLSTLILVFTLVSKLSHVMK